MSLRRRRFCYFHENYRLTQARLLADESKVRICNFPLLEDANSIQVAVMQVIHLLGSGKVDTKVSGLMLYALQTASANMKRVSFEAQNATDVVIDQDTLDLTCLPGPQWFDRDFEEKKSEELQSGEPAKLRKKPDPQNDTPDMNDSLAGILLQRLGLIPGIAGNADEIRMTKIRMRINRSPQCRCPK